MTTSGTGNIGSTVATEKVRLRDTPEDYKIFGVSKDAVEPWEDGLRSDSSKVGYEWWYFDAISEDGTKIVINFNTREDAEMHDNVMHPTVWVHITRPDGTKYDKGHKFRADEAEFAKGRCDVKCGPHSFKGNLKEYSIKVAPDDGFGVDLKLTSTSSPFRPATGYFTFGEHDEQYMTWLCVVPKGRVTGTFTFEGETFNFNGSGYHDHQWLNVSTVMVWDKWLWARMDLNDRTMLIFDFLSDKEHGSKRYPITFIEDNDGRLIFQSTTGNAKHEVLEQYYREDTETWYPKVTKYTFENDGETVECTLTAGEELEVRDVYRAVPEQVQAQFDKVGKRPSYIRWVAKDHVVLTGGGEDFDVNGELMYEYLSVGRTD